MFCGQRSCAGVNIIFMSLLLFWRDEVLEELFVFCFFSMDITNMQGKFFLILGLVEVGGSVKPRSLRPTWVTQGHPLSTKEKKRKEKKRKN